MGMGGSPLSQHSDFTGSILDEKPLSQRLLKTLELGIQFSVEGVCYVTQASNSFIHLEFDHQDGQGRQKSKCRHTVIQMMLLLK